MVYWLITIILSYLFFAFSSLVDKLVLSGKPKASSYTFYIGVFGVFAIIFIPFVGWFYPFTNFSLPDLDSLVWIILDALVHVVGIYCMFLALQKFDVSKVVSTIGATKPIFIFLLTLLFWGNQIITPQSFWAFVLLFVGSILISIERNAQTTQNYLKLTILSSLMFSLDYIFSKFVFLNQPFLQGLIWIRLFVFLFALLFILNQKSRKEIFEKQTILDRKTQIIFLAVQTCVGLAYFLQSLAISLVPVAFLATINSLKGIQYAFLFIITFLVSHFFPRVLKEGLTKEIIIQKIVSIVIIAVGLAMLVNY